MQPWGPEFKYPEHMEKSPGTALMCSHRLKSTKVDTWSSLVSPVKSMSSGCGEGPTLIREVEGHQGKHGININLTQNYAYNTQHCKQAHTQTPRKQSIHGKPLWPLGGTLRLWVSRREPSWINSDMSHINYNENFKNCDPDQKLCLEHAVVIKKF